MFPESKMAQSERGDAQSNRMVRAVARALDIIEALGNAENGLNLMPLSEALDLPHSTVHRLLYTLQAKGFVTQDPATDIYFLSTKILRLQATIATRQSLVVPAIPVLTRLAKSLGYTAHLAVLVEDHVVYVESRRSDPYTLDYLPPGRTNPIHCTSLGKALTAFLPPDALQELVARISFEAHTPRTITSPQAFLECLEEVRRKGFAADDGENKVGSCCVGAPVRDYTGRVVAAISVTASATQVPTERIPEVAEVVVEAAQKISRPLGWIPGIH